MQTSLFHSLLDQLSREHENQLELLRTDVLKLQDQLHEVGPQAIRDVNGTCEVKPSPRDASQSPAPPCTLTSKKDETGGRLEGEFASPTTGEFASLTTAEESSEANLDASPQEQLATGLEAIFDVRLCSDDFDQIIDAVKMSRQAYDTAVDEFRNRDGAWRDLETLPHRTAKNVGQVRQCASSVEILCQDAHKVQQRFASLFCPSGKWTAMPEVPKVQVSTDAVLKKRFKASECHNPQVKDPKRIMQKCEHRYGADFNCVLDVSRFALTYETPSDLLAGLKQFDNTSLCKIVVLDNRFRNPTALGWRDIQLIVETSVPGTDRSHFTEIQLHLACLAEVRKDVHRFYETVRVLIAKSVDHAQVEPFLSHLLFLLDHAKLLPEHASSPMRLALRDDLVTRQQNILGRDGSDDDDVHGFLLLPTSTFMLFWDSLVGIVVAMSLFLIPLQVCTRGDIVPIAVSWIIFIIFTFDILISFNLAYEDNGPGGRGVLQRRRDKIVVHYLKTWFFLDVISAIPYDLLGTDGGSVLKLLRFMKIMRSLRLLKLPRVLNKLQRMMELVTVQFQDLTLQLGFSVHSTATLLPFRIAGVVMKAVLIVSVIAHYAGCLIIWQYNNHKPTAQAAVREEYFRAFLFAFSLLTAGSAQDIDLVTSESEPLEFVLMIICVGKWCCLIYEFSHLTEDRSGAGIKTHQNVLRYHMLKHNLPKDLQRLINLHFDMYAKNFAETQFTPVLKSLPKDLRKSVSVVFYSPCLESYRLFSQGPWEEEGGRLRCSLAVEMTSAVYMPKDILMEETKVQREMIYVQDGRLWHGTLGVHHNHSFKPATSYAAHGRFFGEIALFAQSDGECLPAQTVIVESWSTCYALSRLSFRKIVEDVPYWKEFVGFVTEEIRKYSLDTESLAISGLTPTQLERWKAAHTVHESKPGRRSSVSSTSSKLMRL